MPTNGDIAPWASPTSRNSPLDDTPGTPQTSGSAQMARKASSSSGRRSLKLSRASLAHSREGESAAVAHDEAPWSTAPCCESRSGWVANEHRTAEPPPTLHGSGRPGNSPATLGDAHSQPQAHDQGAVWRRVLVGSPVVWSSANTQVWCGPDPLTTCPAWPGQGVGCERRMQVDLDGPAVADRPNGS
jgi:hypothetical protein